MINIGKAKKEFIRYTSEFDISEPHLDRKLYHSFRVMDNCTEIAKSLNLQGDDINLASLIGLLHDIARFEQWKQYNTFYDIKSFDHGDMGVSILKDNNYIRKYVEDDQYDNLIYIAIRNHNKYKIEDGLTDRELLFAKIIRDADKLDIFYEIDTIFYNPPEKVELINNSVLCDEYYESFMNNQQILKKKDETAFDRFVSTLSFIYDLNYDISLNMIRENDYCEKTISKIHFEDENSQTRFNNIINLFYKTIKKEV